MKVPKIKSKKETRDSILYVRVSKKTKEYYMKEAAKLNMSLGDFITLIAEEMRKMR